MNIEAIKEIQNSSLSRQAKTIGTLGAVLNVNPDILIRGMITAQSKHDTKEAEKKLPELIKPEDYTETESIVHDMLTENTGVAMMDSGGSYGRSWQRNRSITDFRKFDKIKIDSISHQDIDGITRNVFHAICDTLEYDPDYTREFKAFARRKKYNDSYWMEIMEDFAEKETDGSSEQIGKPESINTYNGECMLSQTLQFVPFSRDNEEFVILQIHGGCDVRGGYTDPKIFKSSDEIYTFYDTFTHVDARCECLDAYSDDAGYHWYDNTKDDKFPQEWSFSDRLQGVYCRDCKKEVSFS